MSEYPYPTTAAYEELSADDRWVAATHFLKLEHDKPSPKKITVDWLKGEAWHQFVAACKESMYFDLTHCCNIVDIFDDDKKKTFVPNKSQKKVWDYILDCYLLDVPCWIVIPKARRHGMSAVIGMFIHLWVTRGYGRNAIVIAHEQSDAEKIFQNKYSYTKRNDPLCPKSVYDSANQIYYEEVEGRIIVKSAQGGSLGIGSGFRAIHLSEAGKFEESAATIVYQTLASVPQTGFSLVAVESTGMGPTGLLWRYRNLANEDEKRLAEGERPLTPWKKFFFPWFERDPSHVEMKFHDQKHRKAVIGSLTEYQKGVRQTVLDSGYTEDEADGRMLWYTQERARVSEPTPELSDAEMRREHPSYESECFEDSLKSAFDATRIQACRDEWDALVAKGKSNQPGGVVVRRYDLHWPEWVGGRDLVPFETPMPTLLPSMRGHLHVIEHPVSGHEYVASADTAMGGGGKGDYQASVVIDRVTEKPVAWYESKVTIDEWQKEYRLLAKYYNDAWMIPEVNFDHLFVNQYVHTDREPFLFARQGPVDKMTDEPTKMYGYRTTGPAKNVLMRRGQRKLYQNPQIFLCPRTLEQLPCFTQDTTASGTPVFRGAPDGSGLNDDVAMAHLIAIEGHYELEAYEPPMEKEPNERKPHDVLMMESDRAAGEARGREFDQWSC